MSTSTSFFQNILFATDFSKCAAVGLKTALMLARKFGSNLTLAHVVRDVPGANATFDYGTGWQITPDELERLQNALRSDAEQRLQALIAEHRSSGVQMASATFVGPAH